MLKLDLIVGARPNFIKIAPIIHAIEMVNKPKILIKYRLIHTGQHYDPNLSSTFFKQLQIPTPEFNFNVGSGSQAEQTASIMVKYEKILTKKKSDLCLVVGDVTSTMACAITARKMLVPVAHVEGGIRSGDVTMPEEINRIVTDSIANYFFTTSEIANRNLKNSGVKEEQIFFVGNTMIDTLLKNKHRFQKPELWNKLNLFYKGFFILTLHRPGNVDKDQVLFDIVNEIIAQTKNLPIIFPIHPRTAKVFSSLNITDPRLNLVEPLSYLEFNYLVEKSKCVITDSGGITEETTVMGVPCMTLRDTTERPETITFGTNELLGTNIKAIGPAMEKLFTGKWKMGNIPEKWDGKTSERIVSSILKIFI